jgi:hypothetical protein
LIKFALLFLDEAFGLFGRFALLAERFFCGLFLAVYARKRNNALIHRGDNLIDHAGLRLLSRSR